MAHNIASIDQGSESSMHDLHRTLPCMSSSKKPPDRRAAASGFPTRNPSATRNGGKACSLNFFLPIPNPSGKIPNLSAEIQDFLFAKKGYVSCRGGNNFCREVLNFHFMTSSCEKETSNFSGEVHPAKMEVGNFQEKAELPAAKFIRKRDLFRIAKKKFRNARKKSRARSLQKSVCRAQACPAKHPDGYREVPF